jgi:predicted RNase H-like HicB family nuclease
MAPDDYLKKPYGRVVVPDSDGTFRAEIIEFPGCIAVGDTAAAALANLEDVAASWLETTIAKGQRIPEPTESVGFSGKLVLRLPKSLHKKAAHMAARDGVSLNQFIVSSLAEQTGTQALRQRNVFTVFVQTDLRPSSQAWGPQIPTPSATSMIRGFELKTIVESTDARN